MAKYVSEIVPWFNSNYKMARTFLAGLAQARASMEPSDAWAAMHLSRTGQLADVKFQISMEVSARDSANRCLWKKNVIWVTKKKKKLCR